MSPKYGERRLSRDGLAMKEELISEMFDGRITQYGERMDIDDAAEFAARMVQEAREAWEDDQPSKVPAPNMEILRAQEATKRTATRWRYGTSIVVVLVTMIVIAGLSATGHA